MNISPHSRRLRRQRQKKRQQRTSPPPQPKTVNPPVQIGSPPTGNVSGLIRGLKEHYSPPRAIPVNLPTLKSGHRGTEVRMLQEMLNRQGAGLKVDGMMGPRTLAAAASQRTPKSGLLPPTFALAGSNTLRDGPVPRNGSLTTRDFSSNKASRSSLDAPTFWDSAA